MENQARKGGGYGRGGGKRNQGQDFKRGMNPAGPNGKTLICMRVIQASYGGVS